MSSALPADALRPAEYCEYRVAAQSILGRQQGTAAIGAFGLDELFADASANDLTPVYAFLEAQGRCGAVTPALAMIGLAGTAPTGPSVLLGLPFGPQPSAAQTIAVPGWSRGAAVVTDVVGAGLVLLAADTPVIHRPAAVNADAYLALLHHDSAQTTTLLADQEIAAQRPAILARTQLGAAAELLGTVDRLLDDAVSYVRIRSQFDRPVGSFQSLQHLLAWAATDRYQLACLLDLAVGSAASGPIDADLCEAVKALAGRVLHAVTQAAIQATGAISFTWEYSLNQLHRRGLALDQYAGASADLVAAIGRRVRTEGTVADLFALADVV
jgi:hypothetical protein